MVLKLGSRQSQLCRHLCKVITKFQTGSFIQQYLLLKKATRKCTAGIRYIIIHFLIWKPTCLQAVQRQYPLADQLPCFFKDSYSNHSQVWKNNLESESLGLSFSFMVTMQSPANITPLCCKQLQTVVPDQHINFDYPTVIGY